MHPEAAPNEMAPAQSFLTNLLSMVHVTRTTEVTIHMGCHTRALVHDWPHSVNSISTDDTSAVVVVPPVAGRAPRGKRPRA